MRHRSHEGDPALEFPCRWRRCGEWCARVGATSDFPLTLGVLGSALLTEGVVLDLSKFYTGLRGGCTTPASQHLFVQP